jgi:hypothetical protein
MTNQFPNRLTHPLTDEMCEVIATGNQWSGDIGDVVFRHDDMRAAYDKGGKDRLELIITWLDDELHHYSYSFDGVAEINYDSLFKNLREAMRPQQQQQLETDD